MTDEQANWLMLVSDIAPENASVRAVAMALVLLMDERTFVVEVTQVELATFCGLTSRTVRTALQALDRLRLIHRMGRQVFVTTPEADACAEPEMVSGLSAQPRARAGVPFSTTTTHNPYGVVRSRANAGHSTTPTPAPALSVVEPEDLTEWTIVIAERHGSPISAADAMTLWRALDAYGFDDNDGKLYLDVRFAEMAGRDEKLNKSALVRFVTRDAKQWLADHKSPARSRHDERSIFVEPEDDAMQRIMADAIAAHNKRNAV